MQHPSWQEELPHVVQADKADVLHARGLYFSQESLTSLPGCIPCPLPWTLHSAAANRSLGPVATLHTQQVRAKIQSHARLYPDTGLRDDQDSEDTSLSLGQDFP